MFLEKLSKIIKVELKINLLSQILLSFFIILCAETFYGFSNLSGIDSLVPLERFIPLIGLVLIIPILEPELDYEIYQVVKTKQTPLILIYIIRLIIALIIYSLFIAGILYYMDMSGSKIEYISYFSQTLSIGLLLGGIGFILLGVSQNKIYSLLGSLSYYLVNWIVSYKKLGLFYLFRLSVKLPPLNEFKLLLSIIFVAIGLRFYLRRKG